MDCGVGPEGASHGSVFPKECGGHRGKGAGAGHWCRKGGGAGD